jgi:hypothetical protein
LALATLHAFAGADEVGFDQQGVVGMDSGKASLNPGRFPVPMAQTVVDMDPVCGNTECQ